MMRQNMDFLIEGKLIKLASIKDEIWLDFQIENPEIFVKQLKRIGKRADIFTFYQKLPDAVPKYGYYMEWDNVAAIPITTYDEWWTKRLPQATRKNVRRGYKRGVTVKISEFNDDLVNGLMNIYNENPIRQGRKFPHYGKNFDIVKRDNSSYLNISDFICAYYDGTLIGFIKLVYIGRVARIMQILSMNKHQDKRTTNLLIAKAVEVCCERKMAYFIYGNYVYGNKTKSPIIDFKERNGFEMIKLPRYYIPITLLGKIGLKLKIHNGMQQLIPEKLLYLLLDLRAKWYAKKYPEPKSEE